MVRQKTDPYRYLTCGGCGCTVDQREHWGFPNENTDPTRVWGVPATIQEDK